MGGEAIGLTSFPDARALVLSHAHPLGTERVPLQSLHGRTFASELVCPFDVPHFDNSQVDGYAYRKGDVEPRRIVGESAAGGAPAHRVGNGEAVRIFTGAPLPEGADAVAMQEDCSVADGLVTVHVEGDFVRRRGEEIAVGTTFDLRGRRATPPLIGLAASFGIAEPEVYRRPFVAMVGTGDELVPPGMALGPGQVYASNLDALGAAVRTVGGVPASWLVGDDPDATRAALSDALEARDVDVLITVGGVSVGDHDLVRPTLARLGVEEVFWRVAMKPGKPFYLGTLGTKLVFGLPGNPVSALVTFALLVRPALRRMVGLADAEEETTAALGTPLQRTDLRYEFLRATLAGGAATPVSAQGSHMQTGLAFADALIHIPEGVARIERGETVTVTPLRW